MPRCGICVTPHSINSVSCWLQIDIIFSDTVKRNRFREPRKYVSTDSVSATMVAGRTNQQVDVHSYLTFVRAVVSFLHVFYLQRPIVRAFGVQHREPLVVRIREHARCQDMPVSAADPRYLKSR